MGRLTKRFTAKTAEGSATGSAKVDTGADQTILGLKKAKQLGVDVCTAPIASMRSVGDARILGVRLPVDLRVGEREATVVAFVPLYRQRKSGALEPVRRDRNLIGHDFLQLSKAALDYSKPHAEVFSGGIWPFEWRASEPTPGEKRKLRDLLKCSRKKR